MIELILNIGSAILDILDSVFTPIGLFLLLCLILYRMKFGQMDIVKSHWHHTFETFSYSSLDFYSLVHNEVFNKRIPGLKIFYVDFYEGMPFFSKKRIYLRIVKGDMVYDVCAAPFAKESYFFSWWSGVKLPLYRKFIRVLPFIGERLDMFFFPQTYHAEDSVKMFHNLVKICVDRCIDLVTKEKQGETLSAFQKVPHFNEILKRA